MTNDTRKLTDEQVRAAFKQTKRTHDLEVIAINYMHNEEYPDFYLVKTSKGYYHFSIDHTYAYTTRHHEHLYNRIVKLDDKYWTKIMGQ